jgi:hypothetical protein
VVAVAFQSTFYFKIYQNNIFLFFLKLFLKSAYQNNLKTPKNINLKQKKKINLNFFKSAFKTQKQIKTPRL